MNEQQILRKVQQAIVSYGMLQKNDRVLVGLSGGPDSVALLHMLIKLAPKWDLTLGAAHLNHTLRGTDSAKDAQFVAALCQKLSIPFHLQEQDVAAYQAQHKVSLEMAGRHLRYVFYNEIATSQNFNKIALGHHADDNAELVLINLLRGSGPLGIAGIPPKRGSRIIRPLIGLRRSEIVYFLAQHRLEYVLDPSNSDTRFLRNRIRHHLLPFLAETYNPNVSDALNRLALIARSEEDWIDRQAQRVFEETARPADDCVEFFIDPFLKLHLALQRRIVRKAVQHLSGDLKRFSYRHIDAVCRLAHHGAEERPVQLPQGLTARRKQDRLLMGKNLGTYRVQKDSLHSHPLYTYTIDDPDAPPQTLIIEKAGLRLTWRCIPADGLTSWRPAGPQTAFFDKDKISYPLMVRNFQPGDRFRPLGMGGSQKLKKFFINSKIPRSERERIPVLVSSDEIIWVAGQRMGEPAKISAETRNILKFELLLA